MAMTFNWFLASDASSLSRRSSSLARRSIITSAEVVKNLAWMPCRHAAATSSVAMCVLPRAHDCVKEPVLDSYDEVQGFQGMASVVLGEPDVAVVEPGEDFHGR